MSVVERAEDRAVRNLQVAVERLKDDMARVELWAGALDSFSKPALDYDPRQHKFALPPASRK